MTPEELKQFEERQAAQEKMLSQFDSEKCKAEQKRLENENALYVLKKEIIPFTRWYFENIKDSTIQIDLCVGDAIDHIELEQSFSFDNVYKGTIRSTIVEISPKYIKVATPEKFSYLITEGTKVFTIFKPLYEKEFDVQERMMALLEGQNSKKLTFDQKKTLLIIILSIVSILIFGGIMLF
jgi:hypothetical protein